MKIALVAFLFAASAFAQTPPAIAPAACGPAKASFYVALENTKSTPAQPDAGKAEVYFIQDDGPMGNHQHITLRIGLDGAWAGAYKQNSYFSVSVEPGEHHLCANAQSFGSPRKFVALAHFMAVPGKVYYFRTQLFAGLTTLYPTPPHLDFDPIDSDEGKYLITSFPLSVSYPKK